jgi:hypothetical protein
MGIKKLRDLSIVKLVRYFWVAALFIFSCSVKNLYTPETENSQILPVESVMLDSDFDFEVRRLSGKYILVKQNSVRVYFPEKNYAVELVRSRSGSVISRHKPLSRQEKYFFYVNNTTPTPRSVALSIEKKTDSKSLRVRKTSRARATQQAVEATAGLPSQVKWTKDRIALEVLRGNAPRDSEGNLIHKIEGQKVTLQELVNWYCGNLDHLFEISEFNDGLPVDAEIVEGVEVKIPDKYLNTSKKFEKAE